jgi:hypothetical protein
MTEPKSDAQRFHELTGLYLPENPNAADILLRMRKKCGEERYDMFMAQLEYGNNAYVEGIDWSGNIDVDYVTDPSALLRKAVEWLEGEKDGKKKKGLT